MDLSRELSGIAFYYHKATKTAVEKKSAIYNYWLSICCFSFVEVGNSLFSFPPSLTQSLKLLFSAGFKIIIETFARLGSRT